jgi:hypothetical protein
MARLATKEAVRHWLFECGAGPVFPVEVTIDEGEVRGPFTERVQVVLETDEQATAVRARLRVAGEEV